MSTKSYLHKKCFKITKRIMHNTPINVKHKREFTILESIRALAKNLPMNLNLDLILLRAAALVLRARGAGKRPHADCMYLIFTSGSEHKERKGNVLFNDALNTFYLQLYGVGLMVKDHSDSERGNLLLPHYEGRKCFT